MTPLKIEQKGSIKTRLAFIESELEALKRIGDVTWQVYLKNDEKRRNVERIIENAANACIDIGKVILAGEATEIPSTYKEVFIQLGAQDIIPMDLAKSLAEIVSLRNYLAHQYLDLKWDKIKVFLKDGPLTIKKFLEAVQSSL